MNHSDAESVAEAKLVKVTNELLVKLNINIVIRSLSDINVSIFVAILEQLCDEQIPDVIREPRTEADEIHNLEIVLAMLSKSLRTSLSHISADEVVAGSFPAIRNLIELFSGIVNGDAVDASEKTSDEGLINLANSLLEKSEMTLRIKDVRGINSSFFVQLLTSLCRETIPGFVASPETLKQEEQNVRLVMQILEDVLGVSLPGNNSAKEVVNGNSVVIRTLLDIFSGFIDVIIANESSDAEDNKDDGELVTLTNRVLEKLEMKKRAFKASDIGASLFVQMFEQLCGEKLSGIVREPKDLRDEAHNMEIVINSLQDSLNMSLSHIHPQEVVECNRKMLKYLLSIFVSVVEGNLLSVDAESESKGDVMKLANDLLVKGDISVHLKTISDVNASFFVRLLESLCSERIKGAVKQSHSIDDDIHNMKVTINTLSDVLSISLSHIDPKDVVDGNLVAVKHLLEVFGNITEASHNKTADISEENLLRLVGRLLTKLKISFRVKSIRDVDASLFVKIMEQICDSPVPGVVRRPVQPDDDIKNVKAVISTLESLFDMSLSHISAAFVVGGNRAAIRNLVEILSRVANEQKRRLGLKKTSDDAIISLANRVLIKIPCGIKKVKFLEEINASYFMSLLEHLCNEKLSDFIRQPRKSRENDIHNMRVVVNTLSDVLMTPLSHIKPREVVLGNRLAVGHLLEVFYELPTDFNSFVHQKKNDAEIVNLANEMLERLHIHTRTRSVQDINASVFVTLYEGLCAEELPGIIRHPKTKEDETHNIDVVIETLSNDVLNMSLSHITGREIVGADRGAISNLLEIFYGLMEFILEEIQDESRNRHDLTGGDIDDPDRMKPEVIDRVLRSSFRNKSTSINSSSEVNASGVIRLGESDEPEGSATRGEISEEASGQYVSELPQIIPRPAVFAGHVTGHVTDHVTGGTSTTSGHRAHRSNGVSALSERPEFKALTPPPANEGAELYGALRPHSVDDSSNPSESKHTNGSLSGVPYWHGARDRLNREEVDGDSDRREIHTSYSYQRPVTVVNASLPSSKYVSFEPSAIRENIEIPKLNERIPSRTPSDLNVDWDLRPKTYRDYLMKYYGSSDHRFADDASYLSDSCVDYDHSLDGSQSGLFERELESCRRQLNAKAKVVRFDDYLDDRATGSVGELRRQFKKEDKAVLLRKELLGKVYHDELFDRVQDTCCDAKRSSDLKDKEFKRQVFKPPPIARYRTKKYSAPKSVLLPRSRSGRRSQGRPRKRSASASPSLRCRAPVKPGSKNILPELLDEFPYLHLTPATLNSLYRRAAQQVDQLSRAETDAQRRKTKAQEQIENAEQRQRALLGIMQKDLTHQQRLKEAKDRQRHQMTVKSKIREKRLQTAKIRKYYDDFHIRQRSRMLKKRTKEELMFKNLFHDGLDIQKDRIREITKYAKEQREQRAKRQKEELESLENFYRDQFTLLTESLESERCNTAVRDKAQTQVLEKLKQEMRRKMEKEIRDFQQRLFQDEDDIYYRELDAERIKHDLHLAKYHNKI